MFVTFEGIEGSGKTTQIELLSDYLGSAGYDVLKTREPGGTPLGESLRKVLLQKDLNVLPLSELLVFMAIRAQHVEDVIMPALSGGKVVLCDRFVDATYAYQGYGRGTDLGIIGTLNRLVTKGVTPNLTILIDCEVNVGLGRKLIENPQSDRFEKEEAPFHEAIRAGYRKLADEDPKRFFLVGGAQDRLTIHAVIREKVRTLLESHGV
jgi:dTMP kinase